MPNNPNGQNYYQVQCDGSLKLEECHLLPNTTDEKIGVLEKILNQNNWSVVNIENVQSTHYKCIVKCQEFAFYLNLFIAGERGDSRSRSSDEFRIQLGQNVRPDIIERDWLNVILGIYTIPNENGDEYLLTCYNRAIAMNNWPNNNSLRGLKSEDLQKAKIYGYYSRGICDTFRPEFLYTYINQLANSDVFIKPRIAKTDFIIDKPTQVIRYGAPGTGKSQGLKKKGNTTRITFHPDTDYASFVGCYKPTMIDGEIKYAFSPQAFFDVYVAAWNNPTKEHHLLIEEINRGNCAQIFGDLFQLLDRDDYGFSDYPIKADADMWNEMSSKLPSNYVEFLTDYYKESQGEGFSGEGKIALPPNLSIIATMNTSDNSLYKMDSAFKRRWGWEYIKIDYDQPELQDVTLDFLDADNNKWLPILKRLNKFIKDSTGSTSKQIGQWFVKPLKDGANNYTTITFKTFVNKVMFFLFNDVYKDRDELKSLFGKDDEEFLFEDLVTLSQDDATKLLKTFIDNLPKIEE